MRPHLLGLDHVVILVRDIDAAADTFTRLGFTLTPRGAHSIGTRNHCIMLGSDYVELLSVTKPHPVTAFFSRFLERGEGAAAVAIATDDAEAAHRSLVATGIGADAPVEFSRPVELEGGARDARFRVVQLPVDATPGCRTFLCQHLTPELVWRPEYQAHRIGAVGITGIEFAVDQHAGDAAAAFARVLDVEPELLGDDSARVRLGAAELSFRASAGRGRAALQALRLRLANRSAAVDALRSGGFRPVQLADGAWRIDAEHAHGVALVLD